MFNTDPNNPPDAISAVKALAKASAAGQRIYQITQANQSSILPNIHHDPATMAEIRASLNVGKIVITHTDAVSIPGGWSGAGYIILDPETNVGAWKIGGGLNGGYLALAISILLAAIALFPLAVGAFFSLFTIIMLTLVVAVLTFTNVLDNLDGCAGDVGVGMALITALISILPGESAAVIRTLIQGFILSEGFTEAENTVCNLG
ncbi:MAG: hypothetical protein ACC651_16285, partial [Candidatus Scalindua sp.]